MTQDQVPPERAGLTVAQMSRATGVSAHTLRYYERAGLIRAVARNAGNQRRYSDSDIAWVQFLMRLRETGMPISQMRAYGVLREQGSSTTALRLRMLEDHHAALRERIAHMETHERALAEKIELYRSSLESESARSAVEDLRRVGAPSPVSFPETGLPTAERKNS